MANLKNITELPVAQSTEDLMLIANENGNAKQIPVRNIMHQADLKEEDENSPAFVKGQPKKELMYEWNFNPEDEVAEIVENVDDDLSWITIKSDNVDFEIVAENYCVDGGTVLPNSTFLTNKFNNTSYFANLPTGEKKLLATSSRSEGWYLDDYENNAINIVYITNGTHYDNNHNGTIVDVGGFVCIYNNCFCPFKSVKIYKITK